ncbi:MAG: hypothetical protein WBD56_05955 [Anaerolineales bacterium]|jgi:hypothetical protein
MPAPAIVTIIGARVTCEDGVKDSWREVAVWVGRQLRVHFGEAVQVRYYDLFDDDDPTLPPEAKLPLVLVDGEILSSGGKISVPAIRKQLETLELPKN